jgi:nitronate monooxygenase
MNSWHDRRILDLFGIDLPILQAPMAGVSTPEMAIAVNTAGGLGALACAQLSIEQARKDLATIRHASKNPINVNFFCHTPPAPEPERIAAWRKLLAPYYRELGLDPDAPIPETNRVPFDDAFCGLMEEAKPEVVSFHFGLPAPALLSRVRATGAKIISPPPPLPKRAGSKSAASTRSSPRASRPAATAATSSPTMSAGKWAPSRSCRRRSMR